MNTCSTCSFAIAAMSVANTEKAWNKAIDAYEKHLHRDHGMTADTIKKNVDAARHLRLEDHREAKDES